VNKTAIHEYFGALLVFAKAGTGSGSGIAEEEPGSGLLGFRLTIQRLQDPPLKHIAKMCLHIAEHHARAIWPQVNYFRQGFEKPVRMEDFHTYALALFQGDGGLQVATAKAQLRDPGRNSLVLAFQKHLGGSVKRKP